MGSSLRARLAALVALALLGPSLIHAAEIWHVPEAPLRYTVELSRRPTHPSAGYFVQLPDGGILRGVTPAPTVTTEDGKVLNSSVLWMNAESGFSLVFADPGPSAKSVYVYVRTDRQPQFWKPESGLTPSAILCTQPGKDTIAAAQSLSKTGRVDPLVHAENKAGIPRAPLSIGGDETGRPRPGVFYLLAYLNVTDPGKYWIAPFTIDGNSEVVIDGTKINPKQRSSAWGGRGAFVDFKAGLHRFEVFQTAPGSGAYESKMKNGGLMFLAWRAPKDVFKEVEARVVRDSEIVRSGVCTLKAVDSRDGAAVAAATARPGLIYWFEDEEPLIIFKLEPIRGTNSSGVTYTWTFPDGGTLEGDSVDWLFPGFRDSKVKLTAKSASGSTQATVPLFGFSAVETSLEKAPHREAFRTVLAKMLSAYPQKPDPVANWSNAYWNNLLRTLDPGEGTELLQRLFTGRSETLHKKLAPAQIAALEDMLLDTVQRDNPADAAKWLEKFLAATTDNERRNAIRLRNAELLLFYLGDRKTAEQYLTTLANVPGPIGERARIRLGDLAFIDGDLNKATSIYADLQNRARAQRNAAISGTLIGNQLIDAGTTAGKATPPPAGSPGKSMTALKAGPLQEVALSENVRELTDDGYLLEARQALQLWEREFPLSKISGDFILREAALSMKARDFRRSRPMLEAYCREIDASSFLPDAASMLIKCVKETNEPRDSIRQIVEKVKGRLKYHPVAAELDAFLAGK